MGALLMLERHSAGMSLRCPGAESRLEMRKRKSSMWLHGYKVKESHEMTQVSGFLILFSIFRIIRRPC